MYIRVGSVICVSKKYEVIVEKKGALAKSPLSLVKTSIKTIILFAENKFSKFGACTFYILFMK